MADLRLSINAEEIAAALGKSREEISSQLRMAVQGLAASTHAFVVQKAQSELQGYKRQAYLGDKNKNVRWTKVTEDIWVVEVDEEARWIEEGRAEKSMATTDWLLKGPGVKTAKDGSKYRSIPMPQQRGAGGQRGFTNNRTDLASMVKGALKANKVNMNKLDMDSSGTPKLGVVKNIKIDAPFPSNQAPDLYSKPRTPMQAQLSGLKQHDGIFLLAGLAVVQREIEVNGKKKVVKEAVTFRTVSSKHQAEGKWMYPEQKALNAIPDAYEWAKNQWESVILPELTRSLGTQT